MSSYAASLGRRRNPASWALLAPTATTGLPPVWLYRGYTGHEMLDQFGLINMNGRMYDPVLGRMLSPDNYVQEPEMTQSLNRYTYAMNNPLIYTDPDGNFWHIVIGAAIGGVINGAIHADGKGGFWKGFAVGAVAGAVTAATGGMAGVYVSTGSIAGAFGAGAVASASTGVLGGAAVGLAGSAAGSPILGIGNNLVFGDPYTGRNFLRDLAFGTVSGGIAGGISAYAQGLNVWNGAAKPMGSSPFSFPDRADLFPKFGKGKYVKTPDGWKWASGGGYGGDATNQFPNYLDDAGNIHAGGKYTISAETGMVTPNKATFGERLFLSETFGITSRRFGNSAAGAKGTWNTQGGLIKMGWSNQPGNGGDAV